MSLRVTTSVANARPGPLPPRPRPGYGRRTGSVAVREVPGDLWIGCWAGDDFIVVDARLMNLGHDGLMVIVNGTVGSGQRVWLRLVGVDPSENVPVTVLGVTWLRRGRSAVRLAWPENGPAGFYEAMVGCLARNRATVVPAAATPRG